MQRTETDAERSIERAYALLAQSEERFRAQYDGDPLPTYTWRVVGAGGSADGQPDGAIDLVMEGFNRAADEFTAGNVRKILGARAMDMYGGADDRWVLEDLRERYRRRGVVRRERPYTFRTTGHTRDLSVTHAFVPPDLVLTHTEDVTDRKRAEEQLQALNATLERRVAERTAELERANEALLAEVAERKRAEQSLRESESHYRELADRYQRLVREVDHRVGNNLAGLLGLVSLMRERAADVESFAHALEGRLAAMAEVHKLLAVGGWQPLGLKALVESSLDAMRPLGRYGNEVVLEGPDVPVAGRQALPLMMVLVEWFINSCKYGAHSAPAGRVEVRWEAGDPVRLSWKETGGPPIADRPAPSLGTELVNGFVTRELHGHCAMTFPPGGAHHHIEFAAGAISP